MDRLYDDQGFNDFRPEDAAERHLPAQLLDSIRAGRRHDRRLADYLGPNKILWATDYPHGDTFPAPEHAARRWKVLTADTQHKRGPVAPWGSTACTEPGGSALSFAAAARSAPRSPTSSAPAGLTIVIERRQVGGSASGKSGGFLALDWNRGTPLDRLARRSFALHAELADALGNPWGYRRLTTYAGHAAENEPAGGGRRQPWLATPYDHRPDRLAADDGDRRPQAFTTGLMRAAQAQGADLREGTVVVLSDGRTRSAVSSRQRWNRRSRRRGDRDGTVVDPGDALAAAAGGVWAEGPQPRLRDRRQRSRRRLCSSNTLNPTAS